MDPEGSEEILTESPHRDLLILTMSKHVSSLLMTAVKFMKWLKIFGTRCLEEFRRVARFQ